MNNQSSTTEGKANFIVGNSFYRPLSEVTRDLGVLAAKIYQQETGELRVLDVMTGCGVRSLRYHLESGACQIWANDSNPEIKSILEKNLSSIIPGNQLKITYKNASRIFFDCYNNQDYYDLVDVDTFGSPNPYLSTMLWATKIGGLLYLTSTDGRTATGHLPINSLQVYGAYARSHPASQEQALRLIIGNTLQQAATIGLGIKPIFSLFTGQTYRIMMRLLNKPNLTLDNYGFIGYCHQCGEYQTVSYNRLGKTKCSSCSSSVVISGAMWLGNLHSREYLKKMETSAQQLGWLKRVKLLSIMEKESQFPPYFYTLGEIGRRGKLDIPKRSQLINALQNKGYQAVPTHVNPQAIKTNATLKICIEVGRSLSN